MYIYTILYVLLQIIYKHDHTHVHTHIYILYTSSQIYIYTHTLSDSTQIPGPRHLDSQTTVSLADFKASPSKADLVCAQLIQQGLPEPCGDGEHVPQILMDYMFRQGVDTVGKMSEVERAAEVIRWTRAMGQTPESSFDLDPLHGYMAKVLHGLATEMKNQQAILQRATADFQNYMNAIKGLGEKKRAELNQSETDDQKLGARLEQINSWVEQKLREKQVMVTSEQEKAMQCQLQFAAALEGILDAVQQECEDRLAAVDDSVTMDLESQLQAMMLDAQGADEAAGHNIASRPQGGKPLLLAVKDEVTWVHKPN